ncbi:MAG TPA: VOC family protein [Dehalococcoidia bacterium]|jgi:lactoylglutathione lyase|nr:VOC family protein [Dehalococcoidia bacterium]|tara:strand:+ start:850 stop:1239 length:390 start_codon:yes stop_codon:yes gene_type:complete
MKGTFAYDHIHVRSKDPMGMAQYFNKMFDAEILELTQSDGQKRIDLDINGLAVFIAAVSEDSDLPNSPATPYLGLDHFGFRVDDLFSVVDELKGKGAEIVVEPHEIRPGVKIAFVRGPENVRIELLQRD